jgi:capsid protein
MPAEVVRRKFEQSYSASRAAVVDAWEGFSIERALMLVQHFCQPIWEAAIWESVLRGRLRLKGFLDDFRMRRAWLYCQWRGSPRKSIDPLKEVLAAKERIALRISNHEKEVAEFSGDDWEDIHDQLVTEEEHAAATGLLPTIGVPGAIVDPAKLLEEPEEEEEEEGDDEE